PAGAKRPDPGTILNMPRGMLRGAFLAPRHPRGSLDWWRPPIPLRQSRVSGRGGSALPMNHAAPRGGTVRTIRLLVALVLLFATAAHAGRLYLRWNACFGDGGVQNRAFACDTNL